MNAEMKLYVQNSYRMIHDLNSKQGREEKGKKEAKEIKKYKSEKKGRQIKTTSDYP